GGGFSLGRSACGSKQSSLVPDSTPNAQHPTSNAEVPDPQDSNSRYRITNDIAKALHAPIFALSIGRWALSASASLLLAEDDRLEAHSTSLRAGSVGRVRQDA